LFLAIDQYRLIDFVIFSDFLNYFLPIITFTRRPVYTPVASTRPQNTDYIDTLDLLVRHNAAI